MIKGSLVSVLAILLVLWGLNDVSRGVMQGIEAYIEAYNDIGGNFLIAFGAFLMESIFGFVKLAGSFGLYIYCKQKFSDAKDAKHGYEGPSFKDIGRW